MEDKCPSCDENCLSYSEEGFYVCSNCGYKEERSIECSDDDYDFIVRNS